MSEIFISREKDCWRGQFEAMASPCEVLMEIASKALATSILQAVSDEAARIEQKYSRYLPDNIVAQINSANGHAVEVDDETARLLDFADQLYQMSEGLFDITSGILRAAWQFDGSDRVPDSKQVESVLQRVGWHKCEWQGRQLKLKPGMEIDLGGIGKEYAVDRCVQIARDLTDNSVLINFGGDLATSCERRDGQCWSVGRLITGGDEPVELFRLYKGAIATSGDRNRFLLRDGIRYSHVLNPQTGWPVENAPHTVSVAADTCTEAGMLSTLALLQGDRAEEFLRLQGKPYWVD